MGLEIYMIGLINSNMSQSLEFYRRLGVAIPEGSDGKTHVEVKMGSGLTFFLDSNPSRWDPGFVGSDGSRSPVPVTHYPFVLEFYLKQRSAVEAKYRELTGLGYRSHRAPYETSFGMTFALIYDPDGNLVLLSGDDAPETG